jgi:signal recognition particle receptor subunit beta
VAIVDQQDHAIVIGIVYDGAPRAGKTTSVRALGRSFGRDVYTPEEEDGRTVYFDWLEHTGGRFDGAPIRCQIVSVPGQQHWGHRRAHFIERADVVVFVGDTRAGAWAETLDRLRDLRSRLDARDGPPVGVVFQANRRDAPDAIPLDVVGAQLASDRIAVIESVAVDGSGVREAFVFAVRLALDRVREEQRGGTLPQAKAGPGGEELLEVLRVLGAAPTGVPDDASPSSELSTPRLPSPDAPSGLVWPPVEGRIVLREAMNGHRLELAHVRDSWLALDSRFRVQSADDATFPDVDEGRAQLIAWARVHVAAQPLLSKRRCLVLADTHDGWRLWQIVRREPTLRELLGQRRDPAAATDLARRLAHASRLLAEAQALCAVKSLSLTCVLDTIGVSELDQPVYVGPMDASVAEYQPRVSAEAVAEDLASTVRDRSMEQLARVREALARVNRREFGPERGAHIGELLTELLAP